MRTLFYIIAVIMIIGWVIGFFIYSIGYLINVLLVFAFISILISIFRGDKNKTHSITKREDG